MKKNQNKLVVKANNLIEARHDLTALEQKIVLYSISKLRENEGNIVFFRIEELAEKMGTTSDRYQELSRIVENLKRRELFIIDNKNGSKGLLSANWCSAAYFKNGVIKFEFPNLILPYLMELKNNFTSYQLDNVMKMKNKYSIRLYELLKQYQQIGKRVCSIQELRETLCLEEQYDRFADFENRVLSQAKKEINEKTKDLYVEYKKRKKGKAITDIEFIIHTKGKQENEEQERSLFEYLTQEELERLKEEFEIDEIIDVYDRVRFGASSLKIKNWYAYVVTVLREEKKTRRQQRQLEFQDMFQQFSGGFQLQ